MRSNKPRGSSNNRRRNSNEERPSRSNSKKPFKSDSRNERPTRKGEDEGKSFEKKSFSPRKRNADSRPFNAGKGPRSSNTRRGDDSSFSDNRSGFSKRKSFDNPRPTRKDDSGEGKSSFDKKKSFSPRKRNADSRPFNAGKGPRRGDDSSFSDNRSGFSKRKSFDNPRPTRKDDSGEGKSSFDNKKSFSPRKRSSTGERSFGDRKGPRSSNGGHDEKQGYSRERTGPRKRTFDSAKPPRRDSRTPREESAPEVATPPAKIRLNRYIANSGVCSRREADELITMGLISVNGKTITELGYKVNPGDEVRYENKILRAEKPVYILLNKPKGYLTTTSDPQERNTVMHLIGDKIRERIYPVGRLDRNTTGLLLLTNDGDLADKLMHPSYNVKKIYKVELDKPLSRADFLKIQEGIQLEEGKAMVDDLAIVSEDGKTVGLELHIGWNRVVRRIFEALDYQVLKLDRSVYAGLDKKDLPRGNWRFLRQEEIVRLKHYK